ncbi:MAG: CcmD family protein [Deltaproteobacteria bacterium]|nr:CcmD family protein [Deltaproteobacteria bacterium]
MSKLVRAMVFLAAVAAVVVSSDVRAQDPAEAPAPGKAQPDDRHMSPAEARAQQFQRVEGPQTEAIAAGPLLVGAYGAIWVLLFGYLFLVARRQAATRAELVSLEKLVAGKARAADARPASEPAPAGAPDANASEPSSGATASKEPEPSAATDEPS